MSKLTSTQLLLIMILSRIFVTLMYTPTQSDNYYVSDFMIQVLVGLVLTLITAIPLYILVKDKNQKSLFERLNDSSKVLSKVCAVILLLCFLYASLRVLVRFDIFATTVMFPNTDFRIFLILIILCSLYCVIMGLTTLGRTAELFFPLIAISVLIVLVSTVGKIEFTNFTPVLYGGFSGPFKNGVFSASANIELIFPLLLKDRITGNVKKCVFPYVIAVMGFIFVLMFFQAGVLGDYALTQLFPFFSLTSLTSIGFIERLDALLTSAWVISVFVKLAMLIYCIRSCINNLVPKVSYKSSSIFTAVILSIFTLLIRENYSVKNFLLNTTPVIYMYVLAIIVVPVIVLIVEKIKNKDNGKDKNDQKSKNKKSSTLKKVPLFLCVIIIATTFSGCLNAESEIKNITVIQGIAIDYDKDKKEYKVAIEVFDMAKSSGMGELESGNLTKVVTGKGGSVSSAMNDVTVEIGKPLIYSQKRAIIIGKSALGPGLSNVMDFFIRDYKTRLSMPIVIADECDASEIIDADDGNVSIPSRELETLLKSGKINGFTTDVSVGSIDDHPTNVTVSYIPLVKIKKEDKDKYTELNGFAIIRNNKYVGDLTLTEGRGMLFANDKIKGGSFNVTDDKNGTSTLGIVKSNTKVDTKIDEKTNKMNFHIEINCIVDINEIQRKSAESPKTIYPNSIEKAAEKYIKRTTESALEQCLDKKDADVFALGRRVFIMDPTFYKKHIENSQMKITSDDVSVNVNVTVRRLGQGDV